MTILLRVICRGVNDPFRFGPVDHHQYNQIGRFLKEPGNIFLSKSIQNIGRFFGYLKKPFLLSTNYHRHFFVQVLPKIGLLFILTSGHTDHNETTATMNHLNINFCLFGYCLALGW